MKILIVFCGEIWHNTPCISPLLDMIKTTDAARAVCEFMDWKVSNLSIHKILYIAHGTYMAEKGGDEHPLIDGYFHAWDYGPVNRDLYRRFKIFGPDSIERYALTTKHPTKTPDESEEEIAHIKKAVGWLADKKPYELVSMTHIKGGAWEKFYAPKESNLIPDKDIYDEYKGYLS